MVREYLARLSIEGLARTIRGFTSPQSLNVPTINYRVIEQPALVVWGRYDPVFSSKQALILAASLPHASVRYLEDTGHLPMEERPDALSRAILDFLRTVPE
jgi:pimeloyl-ACP methyl ester carboxylesterase